MQEQEAQADSLELLASRQDFVRASLLYITPGTDFIEKFKHQGRGMYAVELDSVEG